MLLPLNYYRIQMREKIELIESAFIIFITYIDPILFLISYSESLQVYWHYDNHNSILSYVIAKNNMGPEETKAFKLIHCFTYSSALLSSKRI